MAAGAALLAYAGLVFVLAAGPPMPRAVAAEWIVVDWHTGLAIDGFDPVAYFTNGKLTEGSPDYELRYDGVMWRFANIGDRAAFAASPDVYMPQYGGYDPVGIARGVAVAGNPNVWLIVREKLFLFYDDKRRNKFAADPERIVGPADRQWPAVLRKLIP